MTQLELPISEPPTNNHAVDPRGEKYFVADFQVTEPRMRELLLKATRAAMSDGDISAPHSFQMGAPAERMPDLARGESFILHPRETGFRIHATATEVIADGPNKIQLFLVPTLELLGFAFWHLDTVQRGN